METTTTRRALLKAAPVAAIAIAAPSAALATDYNNPALEQAKAAYAAARERTLAAGRLHNAAEGALIALTPTAPEPVTISYWSPAYISPNGLVEMKAHEDSFTLTHRNYQGELIPDQVRSHPDYAAFCDRVDAGRSSPEFLSAEGKEEEAETAFLDAIEEETAAWRILAACPVSSARQAQEKIALLLPWAEDASDFLRPLIAGLQADLELIGA